MPCFGSPVPSMLVIRSKSSIQLTRHLHLSGRSNRSSETRVVLGIPELVWDSSFILYLAADLVPLQSLYLLKSHLCARYSVETQKKCEPILSISVEKANYLLIMSILLSKVCTPDSRITPSKYDEQPRGCVKHAHPYCAHTSHR